MNEKIYTIEEVALLKGLSERHLTRPDGPIERTLSTYYWVDTLGNKTGLTDEGLRCLSYYLDECGKDGEGTSYADWQEKVWEENGRLDAAPLVPVERLDYHSATAIAQDSLEDIGVVRRRLDNSIGQLQDQYKDQGRIMAANLVNSLFVGFNETHTAMMSEFIQKFGGQK